MFVSNFPELLHFVKLGHIATPPVCSTLLRNSLNANLEKLNYWVLLRSYIRTITEIIIR